MHVKPYLSWSQLSTLENSERQYKKIYFDNIPLFVNSGMALGKQVSESLEFDEDTGDISIDVVVALLPKFEVMEYPIETKIKVGNEEIPLFSKIDTAKEDLSAFKEYKTGVTKWNQEKVDKCGQITFYCVGIQALTGKIPQDIELVYAPSVRLPNGKMELTGEIKRFKTKRTTADILKMKVRMKKAWIRIGELVEEEII